LMVDFDEAPCIGTLQRADDHGHGDGDPNVSAQRGRSRGECGFTAVRGQVYLASGNPTGVPDGVWGGYLYWPDLSARHHNSADSVQRGTARSGRLRAVAD